MNKIYSLTALLLGIVSISLFLDTAFAQQENFICTPEQLAMGWTQTDDGCIPPPTVGGMPVPIDNGQLFVSLVEANLVWLAPAAVGSIVLLKLRSKRT